MSSVLQYSPGQLVTIILDTVSSAGLLADGYALPSIERVIMPSLSLAQNYPQDMSKLDTGLYRHQFTLPTGSTAVGIYLVEILYFDPTTSMPKQKIVQVQCASIGGRYSATVG